MSGGGAKGVQCACITACQWHGATRQAAKLGEVEGRIWEVQAAPWADVLAGGELLGGWGAAYWQLPRNVAWH